MTRACAMPCQGFFVLLLTFLSANERNCGRVPCLAKVFRVAADFLVANARNCGSVLSYQWFSGTELFTNRPQASRLADGGIYCKDAIRNWQTDGVHKDKAIEIIEGLRKVSSLEYFQHIRRPRGEGESESFAHCLLAKAGAIIGAIAGDAGPARGGGGVGGRRAAEGGGNGESQARVRHGIFAPVSVSPPSIALPPPAFPTTYNDLLLCQWLIDPAVCPPPAIADPPKFMYQDPELLDEATQRFRHAIAAMQVADRLCPTLAHVKCGKPTASGKTGCAGLQANSYGSLPPTEISQQGDQIAGILYRRAILSHLACEWCKRDTCEELAYLRSALQVVEENVDTVTAYLHTLNVRPPNIHPFILLSTPTPRFSLGFSCASDTIFALAFLMGPNDLRALNRVFLMENTSLHTKVIESDGVQSDIVLVRDRRQCLRLHYRYNHPGALFQYAPPLVSVLEMKCLDSMLRLCCAPSTRISPNFPPMRSVFSCVFMALLTAHMPPDDPKLR
ncbi:hypothetical protein DFH09DRAFT_1094049 [Mycena vulgaris]|nr:hypothetical protein DFH09DRAFT_1094049 [Mycena vulgaris]